MIDHALKARIPLISCKTGDSAHALTVIAHVAGKGAQKWQGDSGCPSPPKGGVVVRLGPLPKPVMEDHAVSLDKTFTTAEACLVVVNGEKLPDTFFDAGELPVPEPLIIKLLGKLGLEAKFSELKPSIGGLTIAEVCWAIRLATSMKGELTKESLAFVRRKHFPGRSGLSQVTSEIGPYVPFDGLADWLDGDGRFFLKDCDPRLVPRGLLFDGAPGTGKTMGAKWLAKEFGVPLYRIAAEDVKNKYVGESEKALASAFAAVDRDAPAVLLIDEVEKMFASQNDHGTTISMMATLLWWLAEHETRVLTVMTCNDSKSIPPELIRDGRVDHRLVFEGLTLAQAASFAEFLKQSYDPQPKHEFLKAEVAGLYTPQPKHTQGAGLYDPDLVVEEKISQAAVTEAVKRAVKATIINEGD